MKISSISLISIQSVVLAFLISTLLLPFITNASNFSRDLEKGMYGEDVRLLQVSLNADPDTLVATSGPGSPSQETTFFGPATELALKKFQVKFGESILSPLGFTTGTGFFGKATKQALTGFLTTTSFSSSTGEVLPSCVLSATPSALKIGEAATLRWTSTGTAGTAVINNNVGDIDPRNTAGFRIVKPVVTTTYVMTVKNNKYTQRTCSVTVKVEEKAAAPSCSLALSANTITAGQSVTISWTSQNVLTHSLDQNIGVVPAASNRTRMPDKDTTYTMTVVGKNNIRATCTATVKVESVKKVEVVTPVNPEVKNSYTVEDIKSIVAKLINPNTTASDASYTLYTVTLKNGTVREIKRPGLLSAVQFNKLIAASGFNGNIDLWLKKVQTEVATAAACLSGVKSYKEGEKLLTIIVGGVSKSISDGTYVCRAGVWVVEGSMPKPATVTKPAVSTTTTVVPVPVVIPNVTPTVEPLVSATESHIVKNISTNQSGLGCELVRVSYSASSKQMLVSWLPYNADSATVNSKNVTVSLATTTAIVSGIPYDGKKKTTFELVVHKGSESKTCRLIAPVMDKCTVTIADDPLISKRINYSVTFPTIPGAPYMTLLHSYRGLPVSIYSTGLIATSTSMTYSGSISNVTLDAGKNIQMMTRVHLPKNWNISNLNNSYCVATYNPKSTTVVVKPGLSGLSGSSGSNDDDDTVSTGGSTSGPSSPSTGTSGSGSGSSLGNGGCMSGCY